MQNMTPEQLHEQLQRYLTTVELEDRNCEFVSHYCSVEAGLNIINTECLWMSHHRYMNDPSEIGYSVNLISNCIQKKLPSSKNKSNILDFLVNKIHENYHCLITSFLEKDDYLPGWRYYGNNGRGVAIKFKTATFNNKEFPEIIGSSQIIYIKEKQREIIDHILDIFLQCNNPSQEHTVILITNLISLMPIFKIIDYEDEYEWRVFTVRLFNGEKYFPSPPPDLLLVEERTTPTYKILNFSLNDIVDITFGPCCDNTIAENKFRKLFLLKGLTEERISKIKFIKSIKQYRHE